MQAIRKLLVIIDPEQDTQLALDKALKIARYTGAAMELLICDHNTYLEDGYYFDPPKAQELREEHLASNTRLLEDMAAVIRAQGFTVDVDALWGNPPWERIVAKVLQANADLLVQSTRHHEKISRLLLSHQDWQLIRHCPCALLLVKDQQWQNKPVIVVSVDPTHANDKPANLDQSLLAAGAYLQKVSAGELHLFHSYYKPPVSGIYPVQVDETEYREMLVQLKHDAAIDSGELHLSATEVQRSLPQLMDDINGDILVMGAISRSRLDRFFIGSTAEKLLDAVAQDVLILKPEGFSADKAK